MQIDHVKVFDTVDMAHRHLPIITLQAHQPGATVWVTGACHGDEVTGIEVIHRVLARLTESGLQRGTLHLMPLMNPTGGELNQRHQSIDDDDLNRNYPGRADGSFSERLAHQIYSRIVGTQPELVIDLHCYSGSHLSLPFIILDRFIENDSPELADKLYGLADAFGLTVVYDYEMERYRRSKLERSLTGALYNFARIPAYTVELGPARGVYESFVEAGVRGVMNALCNLNMVSGETWTSSTKINGRTLRRDPDTRVNHAGLIRYMVGPGDYVEAGDVVAYVKNIVGDVVERVEAAQNGYIIALSEQALVYPGAQVMTLGILDSE